MVFKTSEYTGELLNEVIFDHQIIEEKVFVACTFKKCDFHESQFKNCTFRDCRFEQCDLNLMTVDGSVFQNIFFEKTKMIGINWAKASWGKASFHQLLKKINFIECVINYNTFMGIKLDKIKMEKCIAKEVNFSNTDLTDSSLRYTDFSGTMFSHTNLTRTDFYKATNYNIDPVNNTLKKTRFILPEALSLLYNLDIELVSDQVEDEGDSNYPKN
jgi:uncharacterized protein YjbI with pentapeptide repeats